MNGCVVARICSVTFHQRCFACCRGLGARLLRCVEVPDPLYFPGPSLSRSTSASLSLIIDIPIESYSGVSLGCSQLFVSSRQLFDIGFVILDGRMNICYAVAIHYLSTASHPTQWRAPRQKHNNVGDCQHTRSQTT